ncbi:hypothetical protein GGX14DRAFT_408586 [Mycena pura]|uniref:Uncharacterized protein n=1 Tax=Mycena pura TaxID=153505 RepID=A0AAD6UL90_9AGAR|nr:hypothetical protein GGX14DRAFT_408586 [Mycena pura]
MRPARTCERIRKCYSDERARNCICRPVGLDNCSLSGTVPKPAFIPSSRRSKFACFQGGTCMSAADWRISSRRAGPVGFIALSPRRPETSVPGAVRSCWNYYQIADIDQVSIAQSPWGDGRHWARLSCKIDVDALAGENKCRATEIGTKFGERQVTHTKRTGNEEVHSSSSSVHGDGSLERYCLEFFCPFELLTGGVTATELRGLQRIRRGGRGRAQADIRSVIAQGRVGHALSKRQCMEDQHSKPRPACVTVHVSVGEKESEGGPAHQAPSQMQVRHRTLSKKPDKKMESGLSEYPDHAREATSYWKRPRVTGARLVHLEVRPVMPARILRMRVSTVEASFWGVNASPASESSGELTQIQAACMWTNSPLLTMSDHTLDIQSSILVAGLALVPGDAARYICLGLLLALLVYRVARGQTPAAKMNALTAAIASANELLTRAPSTTGSDRVSSMHQELLLRIAENFKSTLQCRLLEINIEGHGWNEYFRDVRGLLKDIDKCTKDIKKIQTKIHLLIEWDAQRKLDDEIHKSRAVLAAIHAGPRRVTYIPVLLNSH